MGDLPLRTPTYRSLGKPLPYQLTNRTHAHLLPPELSSLNNAIQRSYGVLFNISIDYPPVKGRLHTRYAPVRRSSADCKQSLLPLDLHVLGLPLAFILSQDQTLHCKKFNLLRISGNLTSCPCLDKTPLSGGKVDFKRNLPKKIPGCCIKSKNVYKNPPVNWFL